MVYLLLQNKQQSKDALHSTTEIKLWEFVIGITYQDKPD